jgi:hypothetical protein
MPDQSMIRRIRRCKPFEAEHILRGESILSRREKIKGGRRNSMLSVCFLMASIIFGAGSYVHFNK